MEKHSLVNQMLNQRGVAAIEFAIVLPVLLLLVFGIIELSTILYNQAMITNASREGARAGIVYNFEPGGQSLDAGEIEAVVRNYLGRYLITFGTSPSPTVNITNARGDSGTELIVDVGCQYDYLILPGFAAGLAGPLSLSARTVMRME